MRFYALLSRRNLLQTATVLCLAGIVNPAQAQRITGIGFVGQATFDAATPLKVSSRTNGANAVTTVGGLSGLAYDSSRGVYYAISDDRGNLPRAGENIDARFYTLGLNTSRTNALGQSVFGNQDVTFQSYTTLLRPDGTPFPFENPATASNVNIDPEDIALSPDGNGVYVVSEGDKNLSAGGVVVDAFINRFNLQTGQQSAELPIPADFQVTDRNNTTSGPRNNLGFESLTINGNTLVTGVENALQQDGPFNSASGGTFARLLAYDLTAGQPAGQFFYSLDPVREAPAAGSFATAGLVDLLSLGDGQYLALERSFTVGGVLGGGLKGDGTTAAATGYSVKLFQFALTGVTSGGIVTKELVLDLNTLGIALDNLEGVEIGPTLADGRRSLLLLSDDNFSAANGNGPGTPGQFTQFVAFGISQAPEPDALPLILSGIPLLSMALVLRKRRSV